MPRYQFELAALTRAGDDVDQGKLLLLARGAAFYMSKLADAMNIPLLDIQVEEPFEKWGYDAVTKTMHPINAVEPATTIGPQLDKHAPEC